METARCIPGAQNRPIDDLTSYCGAPPALVSVLYLRLHHQSLWRRQLARSVDAAAPVRGGRCRIAPIRAHGTE
jgi:hypothetical protein